MPDSEITKVVFRKDKDGEITAVFPEVPSSCFDWYQMSCYAHMGQHGGCVYDWYITTRLASPEEYESLKQELESAPYFYKLQVVKRITHAMRQKRKLAWQSWQKKSAEAQPPSSI